jgi:type II secretory pathway component PulK
MLAVGCSMFPIRRSDRGSAVLIVLAVLALMTILAVASTRVTYHLKDELRLMEKRQALHWANVATNLPPAMPSPTR